MPASRASRHVQGQNQLAPEKSGPSGATPGCRSGRKGQNDEDRGSGYAKPTLWHRSPLVLSTVCRHPCIVWSPQVHLCLHVPCCREHGAKCILGEVLNSTQPYHNNHQSPTPRQRSVIGGVNWVRHISFQNSLVPSVETDGASRAARLQILHGSTTPCFRPF